jgi:hypothetical protein
MNAVLPPALTPAASGSTRASVARSLLAGEPALFILGLHITLYFPFIADDGLISLRYAERLVAGLGLTWTDGERVEGYSNLLWVLATALLHAGGMDLITAARVLGVAAMAGAILCVARCSARDSWRVCAGGALAASCLALTGPMAVWAIGGLEQAFIALFLALALVEVDKFISDAGAARVWRCALPLAALCLTRPDSPVLVVGLLCGLWCALGWRGLAKAAGIGLWAATAVAAQLAFRLAYYGEWVPNTARAKLALTFDRVVQGLIYVLDAVLHLWPLCLLALVLMVVARRELRRMLPPLGVMLLWAAYVVTIGGDSLTDRRHIVPLLVALGVLLAIGLRHAFAQASAGILLMPMAVLAMALQITVTARDPQNLDASTERWELDGEVIGTLLKRAFHAEQPLLAVDAAGCLPYFSGLPSLDMLGINDKYLATHPPPGFGHGRLGHELGDGDYVMSRAPDLILPCLPQGASHGCFRSGRELVARADFRAHYRLLNFEGTAPYRFRSQIFVRTDGRIGIRSNRTGIDIPAHFFAVGSAVASLDQLGRVGVALKPDQALGLPIAGLTLQDWEAHAESDDGATAELVDGQVIVTAGHGGARVRRVLLRRRAPP